MPLGRHIKDECIRIPAAIHLFLLKSNFLRKLTYRALSLKMGIKNDFSYAQ